MRPVRGLPSLVIATMLSLVLLSPVMAQGPTGSSSSSSSAVDPLITEMLTKVDRWKLYTLDYDLQNLSQPDRAIGSTRNVRATDWIEARLTSFGLQIEKHAFTYQGLTRHNVIGTLPGTDNTSKEIYLTGGHMDTVPNSPGANDDGTGAVAAIHMAQIASGYRFKHTLKFGLWNGEEVGLVGSSQWAAKAKQEGQDIRLYVGMDMVGFSGKSAKEMWIYSNTQSDPVRATASQLNTDYAIGADLTTQNCDCRSTDHKSFWNQGFTAVGTASEQTAALDPTYHKPTDTVSHAMFDNLVVTTSVNLALLATSAVPVGKAQTIDRVEVTPPTATITADQTQRFSAVAYDAANQQVNATFAWASSGGGVDQTGLFTPVRVGTLTVYANASGKSGSASVTVTPGALVSITVSPPTPTVPVSLTQQFTAMGADAKQNPITVAPQWAVNGGGSIDAAGLFTAATPGAWTVYANASSLIGTTTVTVTGGGATIVSITIDPPSVTMRADATQKFRAFGRDAQGNVVQELAPTWTADSGSIDATGAFTPDRTGVWTIRAAALGLSATAQVTVTPGPPISVSISPPQATITADDTQQFTAAGQDAKGNPVTGFTWVANGGAVSQTGLYTPDKAGQWQVTVSSGGKNAVAQLSVTPGRLDSLAISPTSSDLQVGGTAQFTTLAKDAKGNTISGLMVDWSVSSSIGTVDANGKFTAKEAGEGTVTASASSGGEKRSANAQVKVTGSSPPPATGSTNFGLGNPLLLIALIAAVGVALAAAAVVMAKKKKKQPPPQYPGQMNW